MLRSDTPGVANGVTQSPPLRKPLASEITLVMERIIIIEEESSLLAKFIGTVQSGLF